MTRDAYQTGRSSGGSERCRNRGGRCMASIRTGVSDALDELSRAWGALAISVVGKTKLLLVMLSINPVTIRHAFNPITIQSIASHPLHSTLSVNQPTDSVSLFNQRSQSFNESHNPLNESSLSDHSIQPTHSAHLITIHSKTIHCTPHQRKPSICQCFESPQLVQPTHSRSPDG